MSSKIAIIASPGIRASDINYRSLPRDAVVMRYGAFEHESDFLLGRKVQTYLIPSVNTNALRRLENLIHSGTYQIEGFVYRAKVNEQEFMLFNSSSVFDERVELNRALSRHSELARMLISGYSPPDSLLLLSWALCNGHDKVIMLAENGVKPTKAKHALVEQSALAKAANRTQTQQAADLEYVDVLKRTFPAAKIFEGRQLAIANGLWPNAPDLPSSKRLEILPKGISAGAAADHHFVRRKNGVTGKIEKCAYVTYCDSIGYLFGCRALARSLACHSDIPLIIMTPDGFIPPPMSRMSPNVVMLKVPRIRSPHTPKKHQTRFANTYSKLNIFGLGFLDKAVFLDSDAIVLGSVDELFDLDEFAAAPDHGLYISGGEFNSGVFVCQPSKELFENILEEAETTESSDAGDQGFLNNYFPDGTKLSQKYNTLKRVARSLPVQFKKDEISILHFVGEKPWDMHTDGGWDALDRLWFQQLNEDEKIDYILWIKGRNPPPQITATAANAPTFPNTPSQMAFEQATYEKAKAEFDLGKYKKAMLISQDALGNSPTGTLNKKLFRDCQLQRGQYLSALKMHLRIVLRR